MPRRAMRCIKKAGRSPLVTYLFNVSPSKLSCCFLFATADTSDTTWVASCFSRCLCHTLELFDNVSVIVDKDNSTPIVWESGCFGPSLICDLLLHVYPPAVVWGIRAVVVDAIESASKTRRVIVITSRQSPLFECGEVVSPFVADCDSAPAISRVVRGVFVAAACFHTSPDAIQPVFSSWYICVQFIDALFHGFCNGFWSDASTTRKRSARSQTFARYASYCSALTPAYPSDLIATFVKTEHRPFANCLSSEVFNPFASLPMKHCFTEPAPTRLLSPVFYVLYRCFNSVPASAFEFPNWSVATIAANWSNRGKAAKRLPRVILDKSARCWVLDFCHRVLLGGCCA